MKDYSKLTVDQLKSKWFVAVTLANISLGVLVVCAILVIIVFRFVDVGLWGNVITFVILVISAYLFGSYRDTEKALYKELNKR